jgi:hypothetical protein
MSAEKTDAENMKDAIDNKLIVGLTEKVIVKGESQSKEVIARMDTGATKSSIDVTLAAQLRLGPVIDSKLIKSAHGTKLRPVVEVTVEIKGKTMQARFTVADRSQMRYPVLIGQNLLKNYFLVDPSKRADLPLKIKK